MRLFISEKAKKRISKLPKPIQKKVKKNFILLIDNPFHPGLRIKKMASSGIYEGRIDYHYRFSFSIERDSIQILHVGPHDEGLGKK